jgi:ribonuclease BN (tRNA processing enzyme)
MRIQRARASGRAVVAELVVLGSAGWIPEERRLTTCVAYQSDGLLFLFDVGSGLSRLGRPPFDRLLPLPDRSIHIFLSHLHIDHSVGLTFLPALWQNRTVIHVPPESVLGVDSSALDCLLGGPFFPLGIDEIHRDVKVETLSMGTALIEGLPVTARGQQHPGGSVGFRVGDDLAFMTDTRFDPGAVEWARGVKVLLHDSWTVADGSAHHALADLSGHSSARDAAWLARAAGVGELMLFHLPPFREQDYYDAMLEEAREIFPLTNLAFDGLEKRL